MNKQLVIKELYQSGKTVKQIVEETSIPKSTVRRYLELSGIKMPPKGFTKSKIKENPFINRSELSDYWLGYLIADGNVSKNSNFISISTVSDYEHLKLYKNWLNPELKEFQRINQNDKICYTIGFGHKETKDYLISLGITPNKSKQLLLNIPLNRDIVRGVFDGDGSCIKEIKITTGSSLFRDQLLEFFRNNDIDVNFRSKFSKSECYDVIIRANSKYKFFDLIYKDSTIYMERKFKTLWLALERSKVKK